MNSQKLLSDHTIKDEVNHPHYNQIPQNDSNRDEFSDKGHFKPKQCKTYYCVVCPKSFFKKDHLNRHLRTHTGEKPFNCTECHRSFCDLTGLKDHLRRTHTKEKPYECMTCGKLFHQASSLKTHTHIHTNEKPFCCNFCRRCFNQNVHLRRHIKKVHHPQSTERTENK